MPADPARDAPHAPDRQPAGRKPADARGARGPRRAGGAAARTWLASVAFTAAFLLLLAAAIGAAEGWFVVVVLVAAGGVAGILHAAFPRSRFFAVALANLIGVYACVFLFIQQSSFQGVPPWASALGFVLPPAAFLAGALARRPEIRRALTAEAAAEEKQLGRAVAWLLPVAAIAGATFAVPAELREGAPGIAVFVGAMALSAGIVGVASRDVAVFLLDTGLLFEAFFEQIAGLLQPAFAFLTFYSMLVLAFAAVYTIVDRLAPGTHFLVNQAPSRIGFADALYFSMITLATVGYGDVVPASPLVRLLASAQVMSGIVLLLFGFHAIVAHAARRRRGPDG